MELPDNDHQIKREVRDMDIVTHEEYIGPNEYGHPSRLFVQFEESIDHLPRSFKDWMEANELVILSAGINNRDADGALCIELQTIEGLMDYL